VIINLNFDTQANQPVCQNISTIKYRNMQKTMRPVGRVISRDLKFRVGVDKCFGGLGGCKHEGSENLHLKH